MTAIVCGACASPEGRSSRDRGSIGHFGGLGANQAPVAFDVAAFSVVWFVLRLVFYNFADPALGSTVSSASEAQNAAWPVTMLLLVPYMIALLVVPADPNGAVARVESICPLTAPLVMPSRIAVGDPAAWEIVLSLLLMLPAIAGMIWLAGRIYRAAILRTGRGCGCCRRCGSRASGDPGRGAAAHGTRRVGPRPRNLPPRRAPADVSDPDRFVPSEARDRPGRSAHRAQALVVIPDERTGDAWGQYSLAASASSARRSSAVIGACANAVATFSRIREG